MKIDDIISKIDDISSKYIEDEDETDKYIEMAVEQNLGLLVLTTFLIDKGIIDKKEFEEFSDKNANIIKKGAIKVYKDKILKEMDDE